MPPPQGVIEHGRMSAGSFHMCNIEPGVDNAKRVHTVPVALIALLGLLVAPTVLVGVDILHNVFLTFTALAYLWSVAPAIMCLIYPGAWVLVAAACQRGSHWPLRQICLAVPAFVIIIATGLLECRMVSSVFGINILAIRTSLARFGLTSESAAPDAEVIAWLSVVNPILEEFFWRVFMFECLRGQRFWLPALGVSTLYASYHVPVVWNVLPPGLVALTFLFLVLLGLALQLIVDHVGLILAAAVHCAYDVVACMLLSDVLWSVPGLLPVKIMMPTQFRSSS